MHSKFLPSVTLALILFSAGTSAALAQSQSPQPADAKATSSYNGTNAYINPDSKFAKLKLGMTESEVEAQIGKASENGKIYLSGKNWIPFYLGNDVKRRQTFYASEGCLTYATGGSFSDLGSNAELIEIQAEIAGEQPLTLATCAK